MIKKTLSVLSMTAFPGLARTATALSLLLLCGGATAVTALPQDVATEQTAAGATPSVDQAVSLYKNIRTLQLDGAEDAEVYNAAYDAYKAAAAAIAADGISEEDFDQLRGILHDLNNTMARAAVNFSSKGDSGNMTRFAQAYVDTQLMPQMASVEFRRDPELYPALVYVAASGSYNAGRLDDAIKYFETYLDTGDRKNRENVASFYGQSLLQTNQIPRGLDTVVNVANEYPANFPLLKIAMQMCLDSGHRELVGPLVERALTFAPDDEKFLNIQAQVFEDKRDYRQALDTYLRLDEMHPNSLSINEAIARTYFNLGTYNYNESIGAVNEKDAARSRRQSNAYFSSAAEKYEELNQNAPNNTKYLTAMATAYAVLGNKSKVDATNVQLTALGASAIPVNAMPSLIGDPQGGTQASPGTPGRNIPDFQDYAKAFVTEGISKWAQRGEFEKVDDYTKRLSPDNIRKEQKRLSDMAGEKYLQEYAGHLMLSELSLQPYDPENETYAIDSDFGPVFIKVPLKNKEAEIFKSNWDKVQIRNTQYFIKDDNIAISTITFHTPNGKEYTYNANAALAYEGAPIVTVDLESLLQPAEPVGYNPPTSSNKGTKKGEKITLESDVDKDIPVNKVNNTGTIALIIANENYANVPRVTSAEHDGTVFARYCRETLGIPETNVLLYQDATYGNLLSAISQLKNKVEAYGPETDVIFYYAGHGVPDEKSKEAYMMPVDADPMVMATAYPLSTLYNELGGMGAANVMVFMDACFSGANRGDGMLADARAVVLRPKETAPKGNMFVLSAADGQETALPYKDKNHGLFTYYLLKKLKDSKGNATLREITDYVSSEVPKTASDFKKPQHPKMTVTGPISDSLDKKKLRK